MELPLVSIIITTYKRKEFLTKAIDSVNAQSYDNLEIIVVDDNAEYLNYREWVDNTVKKHKNIKLIKNEVNLGGALARNEGIKNANGKFISFLDDDDIYYPTKIEEQYKLYQKMNKNKVGLVYCFTKGVSERGQDIAIYNNIANENALYQNMIGNIAGTSLWFIPKKVFNDIGLFEDSPSKQDSILLLKLLAKGYNVYCVPKVLVEYTEGNYEKISGFGIKNLKGTLNYRDWCRRYYHLVKKEEQKKVEYNFASQLVTLYSLNGMKKESINEVVKMFKLFPLQYSNIKSILKSIFPTVYKMKLRKNGVY